MSVWIPTEEWNGQDAFIIGGGSSLRDFAWAKLEGRNTIGCNDAFRLGARRCQICVFGDASWFHRAKWDLEKYQGRVVSCAPTLLHLNLPWLLAMDRVRDGLGEGSKLGWNYSTGAAAICLAVRLGAIRIFLLGFDLYSSKDGKSHWHRLRNRPTAEVSYTRFQKGFRTLADVLAKLKPDVEVHNVTDGTSKLEVFPRISFAELDKILA
jgi:hypothetical protein